MRRPPRILNRALAGLRPRRPVAPPEHPATGPYLAAVEAHLRGEEEAALTLFSRAVREDPGNLDAAIRLGRLLRRRGDHTRAYRIHRNQLSRRALSRVQREAIRLDLARDLGAAGRHDEAFEIVDGILAQNRRDAAARRYRIELLESLERWDESFQETRALQRAEGRHDAAELARYQAFLARRRLDQALRVEAGAPERPDSSAEPEIKEEARAAAAAAQRHRQTARDYLKRALKLDRDCVPALIWSAELCSASGDPKRAERLLRQALEAGGERSGFAAFDKLERLLFESGRYDEMPALYHEHIARHPGDARARVWLSSYYRRRGDFAEALAVLGGPGDFSGQARRLLAVGRVRALADAGDSAAAIEAALELVEGGGADRLRCRECGVEIAEARWRCPECGDWSTFF